MDLYDKPSCPFWGFSPEASADRGSDESDEAGTTKTIGSGSCDYFPIGIFTRIGVSIVSPVVFIPI